MVKIKTNKGINYLIEHKEELNIKTLAIPALGCGLGGLKWKNVKPLIIKLMKLNIYIEVYLPKE